VQGTEALGRQNQDGDEKMKGIDKQFTSIQQVTDQYLKQRNEAAADAGSQVSFGEVLRKKQLEAVSDTDTDTSRTDSALKFSKHAAMRLENRNISLSSEQSARLESGVQKAGEKGINESLVIVDSLAFIVNVPNRTVVTAMDQTDTRENIFTNIDGAVIM